MRRLRFIPRDALVETTARTVHGRLLLHPDARTRDLVLGVIGRAQRRSAMPIVGFVFLSNHCHFLLRPRSARQLADFMGYVLSNVAREVGRLHGWREKFWSRRYSAIVVSDEEAAQLDRLRYLLSQGVKEGLVATPQEWPGAQSVGAMLGQETLQGTWVDRTAIFWARRWGLEISEADFATTETVRLTPLACFESRSVTSRRAAVSNLVDQTVRVAKRDRKGRQPLGVAAVLKQHPHDRPAQSERIPAPAFHAATRRARLRLVDAYRGFVAAFRSAADLLRSGVRGAQFPPDSFPPPLPYVPALEPSG